MFDQILSVLFPERCRGCARQGTAICADCIDKIRSAKIILDDIPSFAFFDYGDKIVQKSIWELKYQRRSPAAKLLVKQGATELHEFLSGVTQSVTPLPVVFVPIPQHYTKTFSRGFNQSQLIAQWLQPTLPGSKVIPLLRKTRVTIAQARAHDARERHKNLSHSMAVRKRGGSLDKKILYILVDDVITTGSTVHEAGRALRAAGAKHICAIALAHGYAQRY